ncbi:MAG: LPS export ABC transporter periplasmic protein LptC [Calditrichia bacterium]|nr:LPS export ABC transporter periplasmic protein LptC [Calditrichia bacterium]
MRNKTFLFLMIIFSLTGCFKTEKEKQITKKHGMVPDQESFNATISLTKDGKQTAKIWAAHILVFNKKNEFYLKDSIHVDFYNKKGVHNSVLTADKGIVYNHTKDLKAVGNVVVVSDSGVTLLTEELKWINKRQKLIADTSVTFITDQDSLFGDYFESDPDLKEYIIRNTSGVSTREMQPE